MMTVTGVIGWDVALILRFVCTLSVVNKVNNVFTRGWRGATMRLYRIKPFESFLA